MNELESMFIENSGGRDPKTYVKDLTKIFIDYLIYIEEQKPRRWYKLFGGYWELIYPLFKKYTPKELERYKGLLNEDFEYFNNYVKNILDTGQEHYNLMLAIKYYNSRLENYASPNDIHYIEDDDDNIIYYIPNQSLDQQ